MQDENLKFVELLVTNEDQSSVEAELEQLRVEVDAPEPSRDLNAGIAVLTIAANGLVLINEIMRLKENLSKRESPIEVGLRGIDGKEKKIQEVNDEDVKNMVEG